MQATVLPSVLPGRDGALSVLDCWIPCHLPFHRRADEHIFQVWVVETLLSKAPTSLRVKAMLAEVVNNTKTVGWFEHDGNDSP